LDDFQQQAGSQQSQACAGYGKLLFQHSCQQPSQSGSKEKNPEQNQNCRDPEGPDDARIPRTMHDSVEIAIQPHGFMA
jgi:hypothetical protein